MSTVLAQVPRHRMRAVITATVSAPPSSNFLNRSTAKKVML